MAPFSNFHLPRLSLISGLPALWLSMTAPRRGPLGTSANDILRMIWIIESLDASCFHRSDIRTSIPSVEDRLQETRWLEWNVVNPYLRQRQRAASEYNDSGRGHR